jgi:hypothetical protein
MALHMTATTTARFPPAEFTLTTRVPESIQRAAAPFWRIHQWLQQVAMGGSNAIQCCGILCPGAREYFNDTTVRPISRARETATKSEATADPTTQPPPFYHTLVGVWTLVLPGRKGETLVLSDASVYCDENGSRSIRQCW